MRKGSPNYRQINWIKNNVFKTYCHVLLVCSFEFFSDEVLWTRAETMAKIEMQKERDKKQGRKLGAQSINYLSLFIFFPSAWKCWVSFQHNTADINFLLLLSESCQIFASYLQLLNCFNGAATRVEFWSSFFWCICIGYKENPP